MQPEAEHVVFEPEHLHPASVGLHVRADPLQRLLNPGLEVDRVEAVDHQQARDDTVRDERVLHLRTGSAGLVEHLDDPLETLAVQLEQRVEQLLRSRPRVRVVERLDARDELLDPVDDAPWPTRGPSACAPPS